MMFRMPMISSHGMSGCPAADLLGESSRGLTDQEDLVKHGCRGALVGLECCEVHLADESRGALCSSENVLDAQLPITRHAVPRGALCLGDAGADRRP